MRDFSTADVVVMMFSFCLTADAEGLVAKLKSFIGFDLPYEDQIEV